MPLSLSIQSPGIKSDRLCFSLLPQKMKDHHVEKNKGNIIEKPLTPPIMPHPPPKLERTPSINAEPKTLFQEELNAARETALKIINTHTKEEALEIFLKGLVPVESSNVNVNANIKQADEDDIDEEY